MKNIYLSIIAGIISFISIGQNVTIPDPVFKQRLIGLGVDTNGDNQIQVSEALATTNLFASSPVGQADYVSIEGIEAFTNLDSLDITSNNVISIDLSALTNLKYLRAGSNDLVDVNLNGLTNLKFASLWYNNISVLDVSTLVSLETLYLSGNNLDELNITSLQSIKSLVVNSNNLNELNVSSLINLEYIECSSNDISELDVALLTNLTDLFCSGNSIANLDVSNLIVLRQIEASNNNLENLDCSNTLVEYVSVENNVNLVSVNVNNGIFSGSDPDLLAFGIRLSNTPSLTTVCIDNNPMEIEALSFSGYDSDAVAVFTGVNCTEELGIATNTLVDIKIFPNPIDETFTITNRDLVIRYTLVDITGKSIVETASYESIKTTVLNLQQNVYFLKIDLDNNTSQTIKLIKH